MGYKMTRQGFSKLIENLGHRYRLFAPVLKRGAVENKEHIGYIVDRTGFEEFHKFIMKDVHLGPKCEMNGRPY